MGQNKTLILAFQTNKTYLPLLYLSLERFTFLSFPEVVLLVYNAAELIELAFFAGSPVYIYFLMGHRTCFPEAEVTGWFP